MQAAIEMNNTGLTALAASVNQEKRRPGDDAAVTVGCAGQALGLRVSCGQQHLMGVYVREMTKRASSYGSRKADFFAQVR